LNFRLTTAIFTILATASPATTVEIRNDRGGFLHERILEIDTLRYQGHAVAIKGQVCFSTCTMYLGLPQTCVDPGTIFGFHGPSRNGRALPAEQFEYFSRVMADYYPAMLAEWFMETGRNRISGIYKIRGREIISMGAAAACE